MKSTLGPQGLTMQRTLICKFSSFLILFIWCSSLLSLSSAALYTSQYFLLPNSQKITIPVSKSQFSSVLNASTQFIKISAKVELLDDNGTYSQKSYTTGNIIVKYWKNDKNTPSSQVMNYPYSYISTTKEFPTATDPFDKGLVDINALYNYQSEHNFIHSLAGQSSDLLFVLAIYRYPNVDVSDALGMSDWMDEVRVTVTVDIIAPNDINCKFCNMKTYCPTKNCKCYQEKYNDCRVRRKNLPQKIDLAPKLNDIGTLKPGTVSLFQIQPQTTKQLVPIQIVMNFADPNTTRALKPQPSSIYLMVFIENKTSSSFSIPNLYNFDLLDSPSFTKKIVSQNLENMNLLSDLYPSAQASKNAISLAQKLTITKNQILTAAVYYLDGSNYTLASSQITYEMQMNFSTLPTVETAPNQGVMSLAFVIGMIALGFFVLIMLICLLHCMVTRRFSFLSIFHNSESSIRTNHTRNGEFGARIANLTQELSLPQVSFDFLTQLIFKPTKYLTSLQSFKSLKSLKSFKSTTQICPSMQLCSICLQDFIPQSKVKYTYCAHVLHAKCLESWFLKELSCPICRQNLQAKDIYEYEYKVHSQIIENQYYEELLGDETEILKQLLGQFKKAQSSKSIIYQSKQTQQSLVNNDSTLPNKPFEPTLQDISNLSYLQKTHQKLSKTHQLTYLQNSTTQLLQYARQVFAHNQHLSSKKFLRTYHFYRSIYLYHKINKNFQQESVVEQENVYFEDKDIGEKEEMEVESQANVEIPCDQFKKTQHLASTELKIKQNTQQIEEYHFPPTKLNFDASLKHSYTQQFKPKRRSVKKQPFHLDLGLDHVLSPQTKQDDRPVAFFTDSQVESSQSSDPPHPKPPKSSINLKHKTISMHQQLDQLQRDINPTTNRPQSKPHHQSMKIIFPDTDSDNERYHQTIISQDINSQNFSRR